MIQIHVRGEKRRAREMGGTKESLIIVSQSRVDSNLDCECEIGPLWMTNQGLKVQKSKSSCKVPAMWEVYCYQSTYPKEEILSTKMLSFCTTQTELKSSILGSKHLTVIKDDWSHYVFKTQQLGVQLLPTWCNRKQVMCSCCSWANGLMPRRRPSHASQIEWGCPITQKPTQCRSPSKE